MGAKKSLGYLLSIVGIAIIAIGTMQPLRDMVKIIPTQITNIYLMIIGLVIVAFGLLLVFKSGGSKKVTEVPIFHGKDVVGFRRINK
jgi:hypothetical protein